MLGMKETQRHYRILLIDGGRVVERISFEGPDDLSALDAALAHSKNHSAEVWEGQRRVAVMAKGGEAPSE